MSDMNIRIKIALLIDEARAQLQQFQNQLNNTGNNANLGGAQLSAEAQRIRQANQQARESMDELGRSSLGLRGALQSLIGVFSVFAMYQTAKELIQIADNMKLIDGRIRVATAANVDASEAVKGHDQAYRSLLDISMRTGASFEANATLFARINVPMQQMGGSVKNTLAFTEMLSKALVISGAGAGETASVIRQMSQAMASGVLRGDEFNNIMENGSRVAQALADGLGVNVGALRKMAEAGELTINKVMPALMSQAEKLNAEYSTIPATVGRSFERIKTAFDQYINSADESAGVTDSMAQSLDDMARNFTPIIEGMVAVGRIVISVFAVQAVQALANYGQAQIAAVAAKRELLVMETAHGQALVMNAEMTLNNVTARKAQMQADLQAAAQRMNLMRAEVAAAQAEVNATAGTTAHGNAVYRLTVAQQELSLATSQVSALGQANAAITAEQMAATEGLAAAQQANNVSMLASLKTMGLMGVAMNALNVAMAAFVGWEIGSWLNSFTAVKNEAVATVAVFHKMFASLKLVYDLTKAIATGGSMDKVMTDYRATIQAIDDTRDAAIAYNKSLDEGGKTAEHYSDTQMQLKDAATQFNDKMREQTEKFNSGKMSLDEYNASLAKLHNEFKNSTASAFTQELDKIQARIDKMSLSPLELAQKEWNAKGITDPKQLEQLTSKFNQAQVEELANKGSGSGKFDEKIAKGSKKYGFDFNAVMQAYEQAAAKNGIDPELLKAISNKETGGSYNPRARSGVGAVGIGQFMPDTAKQFGLTDRTDPIASIHAMGEMVGGLVKKYGSVPMALAAYNGGGGGADYLNRHPEYIKNPDYNAPVGLWKHQTADYVKKILESLGTEESGAMVKQIDSGQKLQQNQQSAGFSLDKSNIDLTQKQAEFDSKNAVEELKRLKEQGKIGIKEYYSTLSDEQEKAIAANIKAVQAKMAQAQKEHDANLASANPEDVPKIEADFKINQATLAQELQHLQTELNNVKPVNLADAQKELLEEHRKVAEEEINLKEQADNALLEMAQADAQQLLELGQLSNEQFLEKQREFESQRYQIALKAAQDRRALLDDGDVSGKAKALNAEKNIGMQHAAQMKDINHKMAMDSQASFNSIVSPIKSAFSSTVQGVLQGTTTLKQGLKNMAQSIVLSFASALTNMAIDSAAHWAWEVMGFGAKETTKAGLKTTSEAAQTAATATGVASRTAVEQTGSATSKAIEASTGMSKITTKAASAAAGAYDATVGIPFIGPVLAPVAAAAAFIGVMAFGGMISSSKGGEWNVPDDRLNFVHKNETILPATIAQPMREFFAAGNMQGYGLPAQANFAGMNSAGLATTASTTLAAQQSLLMAQQKQQNQSSGGSVVIHTKGGDFVHKDDLMKILKNNDRNFKTV